MDESAGDALLERLDAELRRRMRANPLAWIESGGRIKRLRWTPKQQEAWAKWNAGCKVLGVIGANQFGKSIFGAALTAWMALSIAPDKWLGLTPPATRWKLGPPKLIWNVTISSEKSRDGQQLELWNRIPRDLFKNRWNETTGFHNGVAVLKNGTRIVFKSSEQDVGTFEADKIDFCWIDEAIPLTYFLAVLPRTVAKKARILITAIFQESWLDDLFVQRKLHPDMKEAFDTDAIAYIGGTMRDNPHLSAAEIRLLELTMPAAERLLRIEGKVARKQSLVYGDFNEAIHGMHIHAPLSRGQADNRFEAIDPGWDNPCAVVFGFMGPGNVYHLYDEIYRRQRTVGEIASEIYLRRWIWAGLMTPTEIAEYLRLTDSGVESGLDSDALQARNRTLKQIIDAWRRTKGDCRPRVVLADEYGNQRDQAKPSSFIQQLGEFGIFAQPCSNANRMGQRQMVREALMPIDGTPRLKIDTQRCVHGLWEFQHHKSATPSAELGEHKGDREAVIDGHNHFLSAVEYAVSRKLRYVPPAMREQWPGGAA